MDQPVETPADKTPESPSLDLADGPKPPPGAEEVKRQSREAEASRVSDDEFADFIKSKYIEMIDENDQSDTDLDGRGDDSI